LLAQVIGGPFAGHIADWLPDTNAALIAQPFRFAPPLSRERRRPAPLSNSEMYVLDNPAAVARSVWVNPPVGVSTFG
jgi:hypothetical protein